MKINLICVGKLDPEWRDLFERYAARIKREATLNVVEIKEVNDVSVAVQIKKETSAILEALPKGGAIYLCAIEGKSYSSPALSQLFDIAEITFVIGGSHGVDTAQFKNHLSFGAMTFPHQLFRIMVVEQIFRSLSIRRNSQYHK